MSPPENTHRGSDIVLEDKLGVEYEEIDIYAAEHDPPTAVELKAVK
jgi:hypothetical protein